jgi:2-amino-4-hydroxy-6-hydroxymethyldihydropteridine diphosphokinase
MAATGQVFLLLGSNLGDRLQVLAAAREAIGEQAGSIVTLNQVIEISTSLLPEDLLRIILNIEHDLGRVRYERWGARVIDIDILYFGQTVMDSARLTLPHPRIQDRRFVLAPLAEIAPRFLHPLLQKTSSKLLEECPDTSAVSKIP